MKADVKKRPKSMNKRTELTEQKFLSLYKMEILIFLNEINRLIVFGCKDKIMVPKLCMVTGENKRQRTCNCSGVVGVHGWP